MALGEILSNGGLQTVVVVNAVKTILLKSDGCEAEIRHARIGIQCSVGRDAIDRIRRACQSSSVDDVAVVANVNTAGADVADFQNI